MQTGDEASQQLGLLWCAVINAQLMKSFEKVDERLLDYTLGLAFCNKDLIAHTPKIYRQQHFHSNAQGQIQSGGRGFD